MSVTFVIIAEQSHTLALHWTVVEILFMHRSSPRFKSWWQGFTTSPMTVLFCSLFLYTVIKRNQWIDEKISIYRIESVKGPHKLLLSESGVREYSMLFKMIITLSNDSDHCKTTFIYLYISVLMSSDCYFCDRKHHLMWP